MATPPVKKRSATRKVGSNGSKTKETILRISTELFAKEGFDRVTMRDIASASSVTMPTIYHHFGDKEKLYREVERTSYGSMKERLLNALTVGTSTEEKLRNFTIELFEVLQSDPIFLSLAIRNMLDPNEKHHRFLVGLSMQHVYDAYRELLDEIRPGSGAGMGPMIIISSIMGFVTMSPAKRQLKGYPCTKKSELAREKEEFVDYVVKAVMSI